MVFNSFQFLLVFLPACYVGFLLCHRFFGWNGVFPYLAVASLVFYAQFSPVLAVALAISVVANFFAGRMILRLRGLAGTVTTAAIVANLAALGYFKYTNFFIDIANSASGAGFSHLDILLPVGVSFYTFIQIGFLLEAYSGKVGRVTFARYALFATFFPCVTAGPLVLQREMFEQMERKKGPAFSTTALSVGLTMFGMGLFKKVVLADSIAPYADAAFNGVAGGAGIGMVEAWTGSLAYSLQLYFDFSGYSDMAIGLGYMFGIRLPLNFNSPFKATSISEFWRRWHMTMTRFFTTYLFTPLAMRGKRDAHALQSGPMETFLKASALPVTYTFIVAGIWHGAGWTFVVYGLIHGLALAVNHGWREFNMPDPGPRAGWILTMAVVVSSLAVFRAPDIEVASAMLASMWGISELLGAAPAAQTVVIDLLPAAGLILVFGAVVLKLPNTQEILRSRWVSCDPEPEEETERKFGWLRWSPTTSWAAAVAVVMVIAFTSLGDDSGFLYYQF